MTAAYIPILGVWVACFIGVFWSVNNVRHRALAMRSLFLMLLPLAFYSLTNQLDLYEVDLKLGAVETSGVEAAKDRLQLLRTLEPHRLESDYLQQIQAVVCMNAGEMECVIEITEAMYSDGTLSGNLAVLNAEATYFLIANPELTISALERAERLHPEGFNELVVATRLAQNLGLASMHRWLEQVEKAVRGPLQAQRLEQLRATAAQRRIADAATIDVNISHRDINPKMYASLLVSAHLSSGPKLPLAIVEADFALLKSGDGEFQLGISDINSMLPGFNIRTALARRESIHLRFLLEPTPQTLAMAEELTWCLDLDGNFPHEIDVLLTPTPRDPLRSCE